MGLKDNIMKHSQAAMEFLLTYGWAILVVITAVSALAYFGMLDVGRFLPKKCVFPSGIQCQDFEIYGKDGNDGITLFIKNSRGKTIIINSIKIEEYGCDQLMSTLKYGLLGNGESLKFPVYTGCNFGGKKSINSEIVFTFLNTDTGITYTERGSIRGGVIPEEFPLSEYDSFSDDEKLCARADYFGYCEEVGYVWCLGLPVTEITNCIQDKILQCCSQWGYCC